MKNRFQTIIITRFRTKSTDKYKNKNTDRFDQTKRKEKYFKTMP